MERNERLNLGSLFINWGNQFLIPPDWVIENDLYLILCVVLEIFVKRKGFGLFFAAGQRLAQFQQNNCHLPKTTKMNKKCQIWLAQSKKMTYIFELLKSSKMSSLKIYISSHREARNIRFGQQVKFHKVLPHQDVVPSLPHNHLTLKKKFIASYRGVTVIKFGQ